MNYSIEIWKIIVGIFVTIFILIIKNAYQKAHKQKLIFIKLNAYLLHWQNNILDYDMFKLYYFSKKWNEEELKLKQVGDINGIIELKKEYKSKILNTSNIEKKLLDDIEKEIRLYASYIKNYTELLYKQMSLSTQNILENKIFISDDEASYLGTYFSQKIITLKMKFISIIGKLGILLIKVIDNKDYSLSKNSKEVSEILWETILILKYIDELTFKINNLTKENIIKITIKNIL